MLRRIPTTPDGRVVDRLQESSRITKPFKPPTLATPIDRVQPQRKRKRVNYSGQTNDDDDDDDDPKTKKKKNGRDENYHNAEELLAAIPKFPVFKPKPFEELFGNRRFSLPTMTGKDGNVINLALSGASLGIRPVAKIPPRPLHDPMEDHAIVLYDPTIDDRETEQERQERLKEEERERMEKEALEKMVGMFNPHKSLKKLLGEDHKEKEKLAKVPVVIDPRLTKVLRPHQVEGVKVRTFSWS